MVCDGEGALLDIRRNFLIVRWISVPVVVVVEEMQHALLQPALGDLPRFRVRGDVDFEHALDILDDVVHILGCTAGCILVLTVGGRVFEAESGFVTGPSRVSQAFFREHEGLDFFPVLHFHGVLVLHALDFRLAVGKMFLDALAEFVDLFGFEVGEGVGFDGFGGVGAFGCRVEVHARRLEDAVGQTFEFAHESEAEIDRDDLIGCVGRGKDFLHPVVVLHVPRQADVALRDVVEEIAESGILFVFDRGVVYGLRGPGHRWALRARAFRGWTAAASLRHGLRGVAGVGHGDGGHGGSVVAWLLHVCTVGQIQRRPVLTVV